MRPIPATSGSRAQGPSSSWIPAGRRRFQSVKKRMPVVSPSSFRAEQNRIVVNCGLPTTSRENWRQVARATAAHSTATFNDTSSCGFMDSGPIRRMLDGTPMVGGPRMVEVAREEQPEGIVLRASQDGYADLFNVVHHRTLTLSSDGQKLDGEDVFTPAKGERCRRVAISSRCASICIPRSRRTDWRTGTAPCC